MLNFLFGVGVTIIVVIIVIAMAWCILIYKEKKLKIRKINKKCDKPKDKLYYHTIMFPDEFDTDEKPECPDDSELIEEPEI